MSYSSLKGSVSRSASGVLGLAQRMVDRVVSPDTRQMTYSAVAGFAKERPLLASFVFTHLLFSFTPLLLFTTFIASTILFALGTAILFSLFWLGVALLVLVPTLILTSTIAFMVYAWGLSSYIFIKQVSGWIPGLEGKSGGREDRGDVNGGGAESPALDGPSYAEVADPGNREGGNTENADGHA